MFLFGLTEVDEGLTRRFNRGRGRSLISNRACTQVGSNRGQCMRACASVRASALAIDKTAETV